MSHLSPRYFLRRVHWLDLLLYSAASSWSIDILPYTSPKLAASTVHRIERGAPTHSSVEQFRMLRKRNAALQNGTFATGIRNRDRQIRRERVLHAEYRDRCDI